MMAGHAHYRKALDAAYQTDPRAEVRETAEVIDLATRSVLPAVTQRKRGDTLGLAFGILIMAGLGAVTLWSMDSARQADLAQGTTGSTPAVAANAEEILPNLPPAAISMMQPVPIGTPSDRFAMPPIAEQPAAVGMPAPASAPATVAGPSQALVFDASGPVATTSRLAESAGPSTSTPGVRGNDPDDFAVRIGGVGGASAVAEATFDPRHTVTQGTLIPAVLETAIDTDVPGYVRAVVSSDVRAFDGGRILLPRSSRLIGQYKSGVNGGQKRAYVIWTRVIRPDGVSVNLGSPATGFGGETGLAGKVDSHFFARFGSAMLLSVVSGLSAIGSGGAGLIIGGGQSAAAAAVGQNGQIGPTIRVPRGQAIRVFTAKDLDFSKVS